MIEGGYFQELLDRLEKESVHKLSKLNCTQIEEFQYLQMYRVGIKDIRKNIHIDIAEGESAARESRGEKEPGKGRLVI